MFYIIHNSHKYNFVQKARCKHCSFHFLKGSSVSAYSRFFYCSLKHKASIPEALACSSFICNSKYELYKPNVQLNLFENEQESISQFSAVRVETSS